jgi:arginyl-tRNA synthetase
MNILTELKSRFADALSGLTDDAAAALDMIRPAQDPKFGDYQANCAMSLGKQLGKPPREVAQQIVARLGLDDLCESAEIAGPGFINLRLRNDWLTSRLSELVADERLGVAPVATPRSYIVDFSSPNVAKPMHVGHIRSTVIGDSLVRTLRFLGHQVVADNHLGDWGTQFGMIIYGYRHFLNAAAYEQSPVAELGRVYRVVRQLMDYHEAVSRRPADEQKLERLEAELSAARTASEANPQDKKLSKQVKRLESQWSQGREELASLGERIAATERSPEQKKIVTEHEAIRESVLQETAKLHAGDSDNLALWQQFLPRCRQDIQEIYDRLDVQFDVELGESFYHDRLGAVVADFLDRGLAKESEGAICVFLDGYDAPMIIRKADGAFLYATSDLATIQYRMEQWSPDAILYVVDFRQGEHFQKLFTAARQWGYDQVELRHIEFGTVLGDDGKPFRTRAGDTVGLQALLDSAVARAAKVVSENDDSKPNGPELSEDQRAHVAHVVGHAAIKYADLSQNRTSDYVYSEEKMVALRGNTATYLQYSYARIMAIFAKGEVDRDTLHHGSQRILLEDAKERQLALALLRFPEAVAEVAVDYRPNLLTNYLFTLATEFSEFYEACPVLRADTDQQRQSRLQLCDLVARTLRQGLALLGIRVVDKM